MFVTLDVSKLVRGWLKEQVEPNHEPNMLCSQEQHERRVDAHTTHVRARASVRTSLRRRTRLAHVRRGKIAAARVRTAVMQQTRLVLHTEHELLLVQLDADELWRRLNSGLAGGASGSTFMGAGTPLELPAMERGVVHGKACGGFGGLPGSWAFKIRRRGGFVGAGGHTGAFGGATTGGATAPTTPGAASKGGARLGEGAGDPVGYVVVRGYEGGANVGLPMDASAVMRACSYPPMLAWSPTSGFGGV